MSKKSRKPILPSSKSQAPAPLGPAGELQRALRDLRRGDYAAAQKQVESVQKVQLSSGLALAARSLLAEVHFRAAVASDGPAERIRHLDAALQQAPDMAKLRFYRGIALLQSGRAADALADFDAVAAREPARRGLAYLRSLARIAAGRPPDTAGLTAPEANTVRLVQTLARDKPSVVPPVMEEPLLGKGSEMWQALAAMRADIGSAPADTLKRAADQNTRKPIARILHYYQGVAAMRAGSPDTALRAWQAAQSAGFAGEAITENLTTLWRERAEMLAKESRWGDLANWIGRLPSVRADRALASLGSLAHFHLGHEAALAGKWPAAVRHWRQASELASNRYLAQNLALAEEAVGNWARAAEAWRDMVRRRPRKEDHPDYLTDAQVAAIWRHAGECYDHTELADEAINCYRNALKYAPADAALRLRLADALIDEDRSEAATTQLQEIVAAEPQNVDALLRLARIYTEDWGSNPLPLWRQVLTVDPNQPEARDALADAYSAIVDEQWSLNAHRVLLEHPQQDEIQILEAGLRELPGHPKLLVALAMAQAEKGHMKPARDSLLQAQRAAPEDPTIAGLVAHQLLHADGAQTLEELLPGIRAIQGLLPPFWLDQMKQALDCELGTEWAQRFCDEALTLADQPRVDDTRAGVLVQAYEIADQGEAPDLRAQIEQRIREEFPATGAVQYIQAYRLNFDKHDTKAAMRLLREAARAARRTNDAGVLRRAEAVEAALNIGLQRLNLGSIFRDLEPPDFF